MLAVTVRPMQNGATAERVLLLMAPMHTAKVRATVIVTSASVHAATSLVPTSKAPPLAAAYSAAGKTA